MYDSARDCFTEQQQEQRAAEQAEQARQQQLAEVAASDDTPRRRISTVGDLLSPVEDTHDAPKKSTAQSGSPEMSSATLSPDEAPHQKTAATTTTDISPVRKKKRERILSDPPEDRRKRHAPEFRDRDRNRDRSHNRDHNRDHDRNRDRVRDRDRDHDDGRDGKRRKTGGPSASPNERNLYAPRRRSRSPQSYPQHYQRKPVSPGAKYRYRSPPPPLVPKRDPSPTIPSSGTQSRDASPPRKRKLPGASSRLTEAEKAAILERSRQAELEAERKAKESIRSRGVEEVVRAHYNEKQELGKTWRKTDSRIKGLRSFNNWVKSTIIQKFSPNDGFDPRNPPFRGSPDSRIRVLDMGCGKGGDLLKWKSAPQEVELYVGVDTANVSIEHAKDRYGSMIRESRQRRGGGRDRGGRDKPIFDAEFHVMDCWSNWIGDIPIVNRVGADPNVGPGAAGRNAARWGGGGFDVVTMMFCMHYAFESESRCRTMLRNVAGALKKGGRFIGTIPSSDVISARVQGKHLDEEAKKELEKGEHGVREWGNSIYRVRFAEEPPRSGTFRPPWGWRYSFFLEEAVEEVPEYVVPWEAFRAIAEDYSLELIYKKPFHDIWKEEKDDRDLKVLSERMGVTDREGRFALGNEEWEGCGFYLGFAFKKA